MPQKSKKNIALKIVTSYLLLGFLVTVVGIFIYSEFKIYLSSHENKKTDQKLLKANYLLTELYEAENLSKLALHSKKRKHLKVYSKKVDSISTIIDSLKKYTDNTWQTIKLDSVQQILIKKVHNNSELLNLKVKRKNSAPIDSLLKEFNKMETSLGRISPENLVSNFHLLPSKTQKNIREYVALLNRNIPSKKGGDDQHKVLDSILQHSKSILEEAKIEDHKIEESTVRKELQIYRMDLELSRKLRDILTSFQKEINLDTRLSRTNRTIAFNRSLKLAILAGSLSLLIIFLFTFLITRDFWKVQHYKNRLEEEKKYSESLLKSREQLMNTVSHDLKTPLTGIFGYTDLLEHTNDEIQKKIYFKKIRSSTKYIENLVNDLLDFSKLKAGQISITKEPFILSELLTDIVHDIKRNYSKKTIKTEINFDKKLNKTIIADPVRIKQILTNVIGNAYKFTTKGFVKITAKHKTINSQDWSIIKVIDSGIGIKETYKELIFNEFTRSADTGSKEYEGQGLGLAIAKKLTLLFGGDLRVESKEKQGSTFTISLPISFLDSAQQNINVRNRKTGFQKKYSLLIIDDDLALLEFLEEALKNQGIHTYTFDDFAKIKTTEKLYYDAVLTDINMPTINGFAIIKKLKTLNYEHYRNQPIVAITGEKDIILNKYYDLGFAAVIKKPFSIPTLIQTLGKLIGSKELKIVNKYAKNNLPEFCSKLFSLDEITAFLETKDALDKVLTTFIKNTEENLSLLKIAFEHNDDDEIQSIVHRMLPMLRQLKAVKILPILQKIQQISFENQNKKAYALLHSLTKECDALIVELKSFTANP